MEKKSAASILSITAKSLRMVKPFLIVILIVSASIFTSTFILQPRSTSPGYIVKLREQLAELDSESVRLQLDVNTLHVQISSLNKKISDSQNSISTLQEEVQEYERQLLSLNDEIDNLQQQLTAVQNQRWHARSQLDYVSARALEFQTRSMLDSKLASKQQLETAIEDDRHEIKELEDIVSSCTSQKESCESDLYKTEAALDMVKKEVADKNYEVFLVTTQPNFRWGGLITFISVLMVLLIVSMGVTRFEDVFRRGVKKVLGLPKRIRRAPTSARREYYMFPVNAPLIEASKQFRLSKEYLFSLLYLVRSLLRTSR